MFAILLALLQTSQPTAEVIELGMRLARSSGLAAIAPALIEKDMAELAAEDPSLTAAERERLVQIGREQGREGLDGIVRAIGAGYARHLSAEDLKVLVAHAESPAAVRWRAAEPRVIAEAAGAIGSFDLKKRTAAAFCAATGKLCKRD
jgi:hypothetical protein